MENLNNLRFNECLLCARNLWTLSIRLQQGRSQAWRDLAQPRCLAGIAQLFPKSRIKPTLSMRLSSWSMRLMLFTPSVRTWRRSQSKRSKLSLTICKALRELKRKPLISKSVRLLTACSSYTSCCHINLLTRRQKRRKILHRSRLQSHPGLSQPIKMPLITCQSKNRCLIPTNAKPNSKMTSLSTHQKSRTTTNSSTSSSQSSAQPAKKS